MNKTGLTLGALALSLVGLFALSNQVEAYRGDPSIQGPNYSEEHHQAMTQAFDNHDYSAWKELMGDRGGRMKDIVNQDNFDRFAEAHELAEEGRFDEAQQIRAELGLGSHNGTGYQGQRGHGMSRYNQ